MKIFKIMISVTMIFFGSSTLCMCEVDDSKTMRESEKLYRVLKTFRGKENEAREFINSANGTVRNFPQFSEDTEKIATFNDYVQQVFIETVDESYDYSYEFLKNLLMFKEVILQLKGKYRIPALEGAYIVEALSENECIVEEQKGWSCIVS